MSGRFLNPLDLYGLRGFEVATWATQHVHQECQVIVSVDSMKRTFCATSLRLNVKQKKLKLN
jgi:hypothetical protein